MKQPHVVALVRLAEEFSLTFCDHDSRFDVSVDGGTRAHVTFEYAPLGCRVRGRVDNINPVDGHSGVRVRVRVHEGTGADEQVTTLDLGVYRKGQWQRRLVWDLAKLNIARMASAKNMRPRDRVTRRLVELFNTAKAA